MRTELLEINDLSVEYKTGTGTVRAVDGVSFSIAEGEVFGLAGESGCGKSTIANAVLRLLKDPAVITGGSIRFRDVDVLTLSAAELREFRWRQIAMVFQSAMNSLNPVMTIGDQIADIYTTHEGMHKRAALRKAGDLIELVGIPGDRLRSYPHQLSGGMRQRVVIAMATALQPPLLIMDEPTTALDVVVQQEIMSQIKDLQREFGFAILFITHDMSLMIELSDRMAIMYAGRFVEMAPSKDIFEQPRHHYTQALMSAFPPLTGPRTTLRGLGEGTRFTHIPELEQVATNHFVAPTKDSDINQTVMK